ncbi:hypothetical protein BJ138DRAFT_581832 [Hygrophoropsis aurantiaca]|uniref:Uncharacterized protein n=1 Tax=Hygrophoropsis aurantiaca TaxID=72124 RepID=A0ACB8AKT1_9AGAM|nr:hypothetical protein BJ138DRAFT_581832 [Hygrophoropsis aurantiaca]
MLLVNLSLLFASTLAFNASTRPPNPPPSKDEQLKVPVFDHLFVKVFKWFPPIVASVPCIAATAVGLASKLPSPTSSQILSVLLPAGHLPDLTPDRYLIASAVLTVTASLGRIWCFRVLGRYFTYNLGIQKDHRLVTSGPYSFVRHPSYTAALLGLTGISLTHVSPSSFARSCGWLDTPVGRFLAGLWFLHYLWGLSVVFTRLNREDTMLKKGFGDEWEQYAAKVPNRLIPWIY